MPSAPNIDGLPLWLQISITIVFGLTTLGIMAKGYRTPAARDGAALLTAGGQQVHQIQSATLADMGAIRHLSDVQIILTGKIDTNTAAVVEMTHWLRTQHELDREICSRLRELKEALERRT